jgi:hypothetical protein
VRSKQQNNKRADQLGKTINNMATQKQKFELYSRLGELGFSYDEAVQLRRIEMTLSRWSEAECNGEIERNEEKGGRPERVSQAWINGATQKRSAWPIADREAGALRRLKAIMSRHPALWFYHQSDPRGCSLYVGRLTDLPDSTDEQIRRHSGEWPFKTPDGRLLWTISCYYTRGLAVCA